MSNDTTLNASFAQPTDLYESESSCPNLPCVSKYRDITLKISFLGIMRVLFSGINATVGNADLKFAFNKIPSGLRSEIGAEILLYIIKNAQKSGGIAPLKNAFLALLEISPVSAKVNKGMLLLHSFCAPNVDCEIDKDVGHALLKAYPGGASTVAVTAYGEVTPLLLLLINPHVDFQLVSAMVRVNPTSAKIPVNGKFPIHYALMLSSSTMGSHIYYDMIDAVRHLLAAYPQGAFVDVTEKTIQLLVFGPANTATSEDLSPSRADDDENGGVEEVTDSTQAIRITILPNDEVHSTPITSGSDSTQMRHQSWNPYQRSLQGSDRMLQEVFCNHAKSMTPKPIIMRTHSAKF